MREGYQKNPILQLRNAFSRSVPWLLKLINLIKTNKIMYTVHFLKAMLFGSCLDLMALCVQQNENPKMKIRVKMGKPPVTRAIQLVESFNMDHII